VFVCVRCPYIAAGAAFVHSFAVQPRLTPVDSSSCLVTFRPDTSAAAPAAVAELNLGLVLTPFKEYAQAQYSRRLLPGEDGAGMEEAEMQEDGAGGGAAAGGDGSSRGVKRRRVAEGGEGAAAEQAANGQQRGCTMM